jgi:hypothetical protein
MGAVGATRLKVLTGETSLKQVLAIILVIFSVGYFGGQLKTQTKPRS